MSLHIFVHLSLSSKDINWTETSLQNKRKYGFLRFWKHFNEQAFLTNVSLSPVEWVSSSALFSKDPQVHLSFEPGQWFASPTPCISNCPEVLHYVPYHDLSSTIDLALTGLAGSWNLNRTCRHHFNHLLIDYPYMPYPTCHQLHLQRVCLVEPEPTIPESYPLLQLRCQSWTSARVKTCLILVDF